MSEHFLEIDLSHDEFMRRFLLHELPSGFHRIRHYGLVVNAGRKRNLKQARLLLHGPEPRFRALYRE